MIAGRRLSSWSVFLCVCGLLAGLTSCSSTPSNSSSSGGGGTTPPTLAAGGATTVYAAQPATIAAFSLSTSGTVSPSLTLSLPTGFVAYSVAIDRSSTSSGGTLYVGGLLNGAGMPEVLAYASGFTSASTPRVITGGSISTFGTPLVLATDSSGNLYVASDAGSIAVYASNTSTPSRVIIGSATLLNTTPQGMAVDSTGNIYISTMNLAPTTTYTGQIYEFGSTANGNVAPINKVTSTTQIYYGLAVDTSNNLYAVSEAKGSAVTSASPSIIEYAAGGQTTLKTITSASAFSFLAGLSTDSVGNVYAINNGTSTGVSVLGFGPTQTGSTTPALTLNSASLTSTVTGQIAVK